MIMVKNSISFLSLIVSQHLHCHCIPYTSKAFSCALSTYSKIFEGFLCWSRIAGHGCQVVPSIRLSIESGGGGPETARALLTKHRLHPAGGSSLKGRPYATGFPVLGSGHKDCMSSLKSESDQVGKDDTRNSYRKYKYYQRGTNYFKNTDEGGSERTQTGEGNGERKESEKKSQGRSLLSSSWP